MRPERRSPPVGAGEISPLALKRATQRTALAMLIPKRLAAALRDIPPSPPPPQSVREDRPKTPSPPPPSRGGYLQSEQSRFGNPQQFNSLGCRSSDDRDAKTGAARVARRVYTIAAAARDVDPDHIANSFFVVSSYLSTATVLYKNGGFTPDEIAKLRAHTHDMSFDEIYSPGFAFDPSQTDATLDGYIQQIFGGASDATNAGPPPPPASGPPILVVE